MQASLFEMSGNLGYDSERFIKTFKKSKVARDVDSEFNFIIGQEKNTYWSEWRMNTLRPSQKKG